MSFAHTAVARRTGPQRRHLVGFALALIACLALVAGNASDANAAVSVGGTTVGVDTRCTVGWDGKYVNFNTYASGPGVQMQLYVAYFDQNWRKTSSGYFAWGYMNAGSTYVLPGTYVAPLGSPTMYVKVSVRFYKNGFTTNWMSTGHFSSNVNYQFGTEINTGTYCKL